MAPDMVDRLCDFAGVEPRRQFRSDYELVMRCIDRMVQRDHYDSTNALSRMADSQPDLFEACAESDLFNEALDNHLKASVSVVAEAQRKLKETNREMFQRTLELVGYAALILFALWMLYQ